MNVATEGKMNAAIEITLSMATNGDPFVVLVDGKTAPICEPVTVGHDFLRFSVGKSAGDPIWTVPFSSIVRIQSPVNSR